MKIWHVTTSQPRRERRVGALFEVERRVKRRTQRQTREWVPKLLEIFIISKNQLTMNILRVLESRECVLQESSRLHHVGFVFVVNLPCGFSGIFLAGSYCIDQKNPKSTVDQKSTENKWTEKSLLVIFRRTRFTKHVRDPQERKERSENSLDSLHTTDDLRAAIASEKVSFCMFEIREMKVAIIKKNCAEISRRTE